MKISPVCIYPKMQVSNNNFKSNITFQRNEIKAEDKPPSSNKAKRMTQSAIAAACLYFLLLTPSAMAAKSDKKAVPPETPEAYSDGVRDDSTSEFIFPSDKPDNSLIKNFKAEELERSEAKTVTAITCEYNNKPLSITVEQKGANEASLEGIYIEETFYMHAIKDPANGIKITRTKDKEGKEEEESLVLTNNDINFIRDLLRNNKAIDINDITNRMINLDGDKEGLLLIAGLIALCFLVPGGYCIGRKIHFNTMVKQQPSLLEDDAEMFFWG